MNILFTRELATRLEGTGVTANCLHPGAVATNIGAPPKLIAWVTKLILKSPEQGARASLRLATDPALATTSGCYFDQPPEHRQEAQQAARDRDLGRRLWHSPSGSSTPESAANPSTFGTLPRARCRRVRGARRQAATSVSFPMASATSSGASSGSMWPRPGSTMSSAPGMAGQQLARATTGREPVVRAHQDRGGDPDGGEPGAVVHPCHRRRGSRRATAPGGGDEGVVRWPARATGAPGCPTRRRGSAPSPAPRDAAGARSPVHRMDDGRTGRGGQRTRQDRAAVATSATPRTRSRTTSGWLHGQRLDGHAAHRVPGQDEVVALDRRRAPRAGPRPADRRSSVPSRAVERRGRAGRRAPRGGRRRPAGGRRAPRTPSCPSSSAAGRRSGPSSGPATNTASSAPSSVVTVALAPSGRVSPSGPHGSSPVGPAPRSDRVRTTAAATSPPRRGDRERRRARAVLRPSSSPCRSRCHRRPSCRAVWHPARGVAARWPSGGQGGLGGGRDGRSTGADRRRRRRRACPRAATRFGLVYVLVAVWVAAVDRAPEPTAPRGSARQRRPRRRRGGRPVARCPGATVDTVARGATAATTAAGGTARGRPPAPARTGTAGVSKGGIACAVRACASCRATRTRRRASRPSRATTAAPRHRASPPTPSGSCAGRFPESANSQAVDAVVAQAGGADPRARVRATRAGSSRSSRSTTSSTAARSSGSSTSRASATTPQEVAGPRPGGRLPRRRGGGQRAEGLRGGRRAGRGEQAVRRVRRRSAAWSCSTARRTRPRSSTGTATRTRGRSSPTASASTTRSASTSGSGSWAVRRKWAGDAAHGQADPQVRRLHARRATATDDTCAKIRDCDGRASTATATAVPLRVRARRVAVPRRGRPRRHPAQARRRHHRGDGLRPDLDDLPHPVGDVAGLAPRVVPHRDRRSPTSTTRPASTTRSRSTATCSA